MQTSSNSETINGDTPPQRVETEPLVEEIGQESNEAFAPIETTDTNMEEETENTVSITNPFETKAKTKPSTIDIIANQNSDTWPVPRKFTHNHFTRGSAKVAYVLENAPQYAIQTVANQPNT